MIPRFCHATVVLVLIHPATHKRTDDYSRAVKLGEDNNKLEMKMPFSALVFSQANRDRTSSFQVAAAAAGTETYRLTLGTCVAILGLCIPSSSSSS